ncbi:MAG: hypothetical protein HYT07_00355 [Candidatus Levybacteria bacterium]|nr:hypothetical protein [Candidatus Levybacteria bacterium]
MENNQNPNTIFSFKILNLIVLLIILINLAYLDFVYFRDLNKSSGKENTLVTPAQNTANQGEPSQICPNSCIAAIYEATSSVKLASPSSEKNATPTKSPVSASNATSQTKEFFVPFGSGSSSAEDWEDVGGLKAYIDSSQYPSIKSVVFEASVRIPTGNQVAYVRLFNETDKHPVWFSEVSMEGGTPQFLVSKPITLDQGNKLYKVQMKTQLKAPAILDQARIHITTK